MKKHISIARAAKIMGVNNKTLTSWIDTRGFPAMGLYNAGKRFRRFVGIEEMIGWIYKEQFWGPRTRSEVEHIVRTALLP